MIANVDVLNVSRPAQRWSVRGVLVDGGDLIVLTWALPVAVLVVGTPIALAITGGLWLGRWAMNAF